MRSIPNNEFAALRAEQLAAAARSGDVAAAVALLAAGAEPCRSIDVYGSTALHAAVAGASLPMVRLLLDAAPSEAVVLAGPHADAESPMELGERLARLGQLVNADAVLSALAFAAPRAEENADGEPPISLQIIDALQIIYALHAAVKRSDVHGAMDAIECGSRAAGRDGFDVDHPVDTYGTTALIASIGVLDRCAPDSAVAERARMVFDLLLETGASPTAVRSDDIDAESALEYATRLATRTSSPNGRLVAIAELLRVASAEASTRLAASAAALTPLACVGPAKSPVLLTRAAPRYARAVGDAPSAASAAPTIVACGTTNAAKLACVRSAFTALGWRNVRHSRWKTRAPGWASSLLGWRRPPRAREIARRTPSRAPSRAAPRSAWASSPESRCWAARRSISAPVRSRALRPGERARGPEARARRSPWGSPRFGPSRPPSPSRSRTAAPGTTMRSSAAESIPTRPALASSPR